MVQAILRLPDVQSRTGLSRSEIYRREGLGEFPKRIHLGTRSVGWIAEEVQEWIETRIRESRNIDSTKGATHSKAQGASA
jgi:prophage regulatory protein